VAYGAYFRNGEFVEKDDQVYVEWLKKAANQNNPKAIFWLGCWLQIEGRDTDKAYSYFHAGAEFGWKDSMGLLAVMLRDGEGCEKDLGQAVIWGAKGDSWAFWDILQDARRALKSAATEDLDCDFDQLCYLLGWGLFWHQYEREALRPDVQKAFANQCLNFYCSCVELQQKSIFAFLLFWNQSIGIKGPGQIIAQMVWEQREDNLVRTFEEIDGEEPETKRIKK
jgi:hypothetical protein